MAIALAFTFAVFAAAALRLPSLTATVVAGYVFLAGNMAAVTWLLSPLRDVTPAGLAVVEALLLLAALAAWWVRGRPLPDVAPARGALRSVASDRIVLAFCAVALVALAYELVLVTTVPPTNWDSLTYHLARVLAWRQHGGIYWIANAPTARMNDFQQLAEQEIYFLFVASGTSAVFALPQYLAELAILAAVYGAARRIGFDVRSAVCGTALLACLSLIALESTTEQNDLVAASFPIAAACLLLDGVSVEAALAGVAVALGIGTKLTTLLVLPVIVWLAWSAGRRPLRLALGGCLAGLVAAGMWSFVLNAKHTGDLLGSGQGRTEHTVALSLTGTIRTVAHLFDRLGDLSEFDDWTVLGLALLGIAVGALVARHARASGARPRAVALATSAAALPLLAPAIALAMTHIPAGDPAGIERTANEDYSGFGPIGTYALYAAPIATLAGVGRRDRRQLALALALPSGIVLLALYAQYDIWITRFLIVPVVLTAPLFPRLFRGRVATAALVAIASVGVAFVLVHDRTKPLVGAAFGVPWQLTQPQAIEEGPATQTAHRVAATLRVYYRRVPADACVGAVMDPDDFSTLLWGPAYRHRVVFLPSLTALETAEADGLHDVVISNGANAPVATQFSDAGWKVEPLATWWILAVSPRATPTTACR